VRAGAGVLFRRETHLKVFGIGLNKTGTKTLRHYLSQLGFRHRSYDSDNVYESESFDLWHGGRIDELLDLLEDYDSCEDWPWPMVYRELDERFPEARFVLTVRSSPEVWYRSLCNMAVRIGPLPLFEKSVYGSSMPHGRKEQHLKLYRTHNDAVERYFEGRPNKLFRVCWDDGDGPELLTRFLGMPEARLDPVHINKSPVHVYDGDNLFRAHVARLHYQWLSGPKALPRRALRRFLGA
jgi:hypothetical protein